MLTVSVSGGPRPNSQLGSKGHFVAIIFSHFTLNDIAIFIVHIKKLLHLSAKWDLSELVAYH